MVLRGLWSGFAIAAKKLVTGTASDEQLRDLRAELEPLKYGASPRRGVSSWLTPALTLGPSLRCVGRPRPGC